ncbi:PilZ domain-containing protein [Sphingobium sp. 3R8]|uniref:PilZ domain-containing protein n=1 Tax=Sphingobium sp. 3R8 TaxID=2874921 RepID=UPI001CC940E5|nr:PilZ domain-containing protein [Sphingobium sp. 3R8]MBA4091854.1 pilus assembly protein PilZ [Sphingobium sp.]MBZ9648435.1 PilZ domain-containing protein [Sphingobium sp. 3R8]
MSSSVFANLGHVLRSRDPAVDQRRAQRELVDMVSHVTAQGRSHGVRIINISALGLMCRSDSALLQGERVSIWLPILKDYPAEIRWVEDGRVGMEFYEPISPKIYDAMLSLIPPRRTAW